MVQPLLGHSSQKFSHGFSHLQTPTTPLQTVRKKKRLTRFSYFLYKDFEVRSSFDSRTVSCLGEECSFADFKAETRRLSNHPVVGVVVW